MPLADANMSDKLQFLWLEGIFDAEAVQSFSAISPAANFWQRGFVESLLQKGHDVDVIGYPVERVWPFGRLLIGDEMASLAPGLTGKVVGYINFPYLRGSVQYVRMLSAVKRHLCTSQRKPDYQIVYSCLSSSAEETPSIRIAKYLRKHFGVPWICIVADGATPPGADGYVYLAWSPYQSGIALGPSIHIDGGIPDLKGVIEQESVLRGPAREKILMYMGALTEHGGVLQLARSFNKLSDKDIELWICGRGENTELSQLAEIDRRIKFLGFVEEDELSKLASAAFAFANPRPNSFAPNKVNYPSKILHYLAFGKPIISSFTDGVSPDYEDVLIPIEEDSERGMGEAIRRVLNIEAPQYEQMRDRIARFNENHTWPYQINRFVSWLPAATRQ